MQAKKVTEKKAFEKPDTGIFYLIPDPKTLRYTLWADVDYPGHEVSHMMSWDKVVELLRRRFRGKYVDIISNNYRGLPRGRVTETSGGWIVGHGNDFQLGEFKHEILSEFKLYDAEAIGKVSWEYQDHETMQALDKKEVESILGITLSKTGFKLKKK